MSSPPEDNHTPDENFRNLKIPDAAQAAVCELLEIAPREFQVGQCIVEDLPVKAIARRLGITPRTVRGHKESLFAKLHVEGRTGAALRLYRAYLSLSDHKSPEKNDPAEDPGSGSG
jgi:DNA-binding NarL/FixJ family response regulator